MERLIYMVMNIFLGCMEGVITRHQEIQLNILQQPMGFKPMACRDILLYQAQSKSAVSVTYVTLVLLPPL